MKRRALIGAGVVVAQLSSAQQIPPPGTATDPLHRERDIKLPNGKSQRDEILKADHESNVEDARKLAKLTDDLRADIEKHDRFVLSLGLLKRLDEAEKLIKKIRGRMKRY